MPRIERADYQVYIQSALWAVVRRELRSQAIRNLKEHMPSITHIPCGGAGLGVRGPWQHQPVTGGSCAQDGGQVHHMHYRTLGMERLKDVAFLCEQCHLALHETLAEVTRLWVDALAATGNREDARAACLKLVHVCDLDMALDLLA